MRKWYPIIAACTVGIFIGWLITSSAATTGSHISEIHQSGYEFINPLLECAIAEADMFKELKLFKSNVTDLINKFINAGRATHISVYFRDLNNGPWFGINERETFSAGSLLKVPLMMTVLRKEEASPGFLNKAILYSKPFELPKAYFQDIKPKISLEIGRYYSVEELVRRAILYSDNDATVLLYENIELPLISQTHSDLGVVFPTDTTSEDYITVKNYASFFRVLFNASYLSRSASEKALKILSEVDFQTGLAAGIPRSISIAHKFGERGVGDQKQLHDCGIIYYPTHPYLLCVMNRGNNLDNLTKNIADISRLVYEEVAKQFK